MKFLVLAALLAVTAAEAYRGGYGGRGYGGYGRGGYGRGYGKREADAEPEALIVGGYAGHALATPYGYGLGYSAGYPYTYGSLAYAAPYALGHYYGKRSADAEPRRGYGGGYGGYGRGGYGRGYGKREAEPYRGYGGYGRGGYGRGYGK